MAAQPVRMGVERCLACHLQGTKAKEIECQKYKSCDLVSEGLGRIHERERSANDSDTVVNKKNSFLKTIFSKSNKK